MDSGARVQAYLSRGRREMTARQWRRVTHKRGRDEARARRGRDRAIRAGSVGATEAASAAWRSFTGERGGTRRGAGYQPANGE